LGKEILWRFEVRSGLRGLSGSVDSSGVSSVTPKIQRAWLLDSHRILILALHQFSSLSHTTLKLYTRQYNQTLGETDIRAYVIGLNVREVAVGEKGVLMYSTTGTATEDMSSSSSERHSGNAATAVRDAARGRDESSQGGTLTLLTWKSQYQLRKILEMRVMGNVTMLGLDNEARWFGYGAGNDVRVFRWEDFDGHDRFPASNVVGGGNDTSTQRKPAEGNTQSTTDEHTCDASHKQHTSSSPNIVFEYGGCTGYQLHKDNFVEMRFSRDTGDVLPGSAMETTSITDGANDAHDSNLGSGWFSRNSPIRRRRKKRHIPFDIMGETPIVDHPTILNSSWVSSCYNLIHKRLDSDENPVGIHFIRSPSMMHNEGSSITTTTTSTMDARCIISTTNKAYVYDMDTLQLITQFEYGGECLMSTTNSFFLFALNPAGLEVWSVLGASGGCLLRFHQFIGLKQVAATNDTVMLLSQFSNEERVALATVVSDNANDESGNGASESNAPMIMSDMRHIDKLGEKGRLLPIFSGGGRLWRQQKAKKDIEYNYNIYILSLVEVCDLYDDLLEIAEQMKETQPERRVEIIEEAHCLLQCKHHELSLQQRTVNNSSKPSSSVGVLNTIRLNIELSNYSMLLSKSFGFLGDVYMENRSYDLAAECFVQSNRSVSYVVQLYVNCNAQASLVNYLNVIIFDDTKSQLQLQVQPSNSNELGNRILNIYRQFEPHSLSRVILESNLKDYDQDIAIEYLLEYGVRNQDSESPENSSKTAFSAYRPRDAFVLGLLFLGKGLVTKAVSAFSNDLSVLIDFCVMHPMLFGSQGKESNYNGVAAPQQLQEMGASVWDASFVTAAYEDNGQGQISFTHTNTRSLGTVMRAYFPWCLLQVLCLLNGDISWQQGLNLLFTSPNASQNRLLGELYLRYHLSQDRVAEERRAIAETLFVFFVDDLREDYTSREWKPVPQQENTHISMSEMAPTDSSSPFFLQSLTELESLLCWTPKSLVAKRHPWRDGVYPQNFTPPQQVIIQQSTLYEGHGSNSDDDTLADTFILRLITDSMFRKSFALLNAEGLQNATDSPLPRTSVCNRLEILPQFEGKLSLHLVAYANTKQWRKMFALLTSAENQCKPRILVELATTYCTQLEDWRTLVDLILRDNPGTQKEWRRTLEAILDHVASQYTCQEFLSTLPKNGNAKFFLPFIKKSLRVSADGALTRHHM